MVVAAVVQVALVGHRAMTLSRQNSVLGLRTFSRSNSTKMRYSTEANSTDGAPKTSVIELRSESDSGDNDDSVEVGISGTAADDMRQQQQTLSHQTAQQC
eukprot:2472-Heterococcus_DN1.PRE.3